MKMQRRSGVSTVVIAAVVIVIIAIAVAGYALYASPGKTTTVTATGIGSTVTSATTVTASASTTAITASASPSSSSSTGVSTNTSSPSSSSSTSSSSTAATTNSSQALAPLISYSADSYATEVQALLTNFSASTGVPIAPVKSGGSFADATAIATGAPDDVFVSASLAAAGSGYLKNLTANWAIGFASDQIVIAYVNATASSSSAAGNIVTQGLAAVKSNSTSDWNTFFTSLTAGTVKVGISDPVADPAGLRAWLVLEAAGYLYSGGNQSTYAGSLLQHSANVTGANAAALVAPLQTGTIQFLFDYKSAAIGQNLSYIQLDHHISLSDPKLASFYSKFSYTDSAGKTTGAPIVISITVPLSSVNTNEALQFVQYVVKDAPALSSFGLTVLSPAVLYNNTAPPQPIAALVSQGLVVESGSLP